VRPCSGLELADLVRLHGKTLAGRCVLSPEQHATLRDIERCRTAVLGGHLDVCTECGYEKPSYNSCRNRHCPKCQALAQARWIETRVERILPVHYFHVVFTLPSELRAVAKRFREKVFDLLFASASQTLLELGNDPERLGAELGVTMVLHTWTRDLRFHPHVHAIVTGGGLSEEGSRWVPSRWVVYAKRPFGGPEQVIRYLGRYTHRVGISNTRLVSMDDRNVTFRTKTGVVTLEGVAFLARFLQHVLPPRFVKIRHYGLHSASHAKTRLVVAKDLLAPTPCHDSVPSLTDPLYLIQTLTGVDVRLCPACHKPSLVRTALPEEQSRAPPARAA
jgi:predicted Zn-ribbon and HTH transcriptional regulator